MAKQSFSVGQVLTANQMLSLQQTAMLGGSATAKTASYTLVAADAGTVVSVNSTSATTITVNTGLFSAGDTVTIQNWGSGLVTITAGTATVNTAGSLIVPQYDGGVLYFTSASAAIYFDFVQAGAVSPLTTKGDLYTFGSSDTRLGVGSNGQLLAANSSTATGLEWQTPASGAITWTSRLGSSSYNINFIAYNGSNLYVAGGQTGTLYTSTDAKTWTARTSGFGSNDIYKIHYVAGLSLWIAVGNNGTLTTSPDGITWTARTSNIGANTINDIASDGTTVVAVGEGGGTTNTGGIIYSSNGTTWTRKSQSLTVGDYYYCVAYNGTNWLVGATSSTNNYLYASSPSGSWTVGAISTLQIRQIIWDGTRHTIITSGNPRTTTSVTLTSPTLISSAGAPFVSTYPTLNQSSYYNGYFYYFDYYGAAPVLNGYSKFSTSLVNTSYFADYGNFETAPFSKTLPTAYFVGAVGQIVSVVGAIYTSF